MMPLQNPTNPNKSPIKMGLEVRIVSGRRRLKLEGPGVLVEASGARRRGRS